MSKHRKRAHHHPEGHLHTCPTCQHQYTGHFCNNCGEKIFHPHDLSLGHLLEDAVDKFTHFDLKIPKSILLLFNPGYLTEKFLMGIRKPFANPVQLFLIANVIFFLCYKVANFSDFTPVWGDHNYFRLSGHVAFLWAKPIDKKVIDVFDAKTDEKWPKIVAKMPLDTSKVRIIDSVLQQEFDTSSNRKLILFYALMANSKKIEVEKEYRKNFQKAVYGEMRQNSANYSKSLIFLLILFVAPFIYLFYRKSFQTLGATLIFSTHFVSAYILFFGLNAFLYAKTGYYLTTPLDFIHHSTGGILQIIIIVLMGESFEFHCLVPLMAYLFFAFRRLFKPHWGYNLFASYCISRIFFFLCFGVYKKIILWIALSNF
jgi:Protein of unknown function (DUF3667)